MPHAENIKGKVKDFFRGIKPQICKMSALSLRCDRISSFPSNSHLCSAAVSFIHVLI